MNKTTKMTMRTRRPKRRSGGKKRIKEQNKQKDQVIKKLEKDQENKNKDWM